MGRKAIVYRIITVFLYLPLVAAGLQREGSLPAEDETLTPPRLWIRLEDEGGRPVTARIHVRGADGAAHVPEGSLSRQTRAGETYFHASGFAQLEMPAGMATIEAFRGFEYIPAREEVLLVPNRTTTAVLTLKRMIDMPSSGWYSGDVHMHPNHRTGGVYMTMEDCQLVVAGEDLHVANLLISNRQGTTVVFDQEYFRGGKVEPVSTDETLIVVQEEFRNTSGMYGHLILLGISELVEPFFTGLSPNREDYPPNYTIARKVQAQGGAVSYAHPADEAEIPVGLHVAREFPIDLALGAVDALDLLSNKNEEAACWMYYRVLNCGLKCTASAGTDSQMDVLRHAMPGGSKVYVKAGSPLTYPKWVSEYKRGRTFVSNGPLLFLEVAGKEPGEEIQLSGPASLEISARASSLVPMSVLELVVNGAVVASVRPSPGGTKARLRQTLNLDRSSWIAARVWGEGDRRVVNDPKLFAHTSPVYCYIEGRPITFRKDAETVIQWVDRLIEDVKVSPRFSTESMRHEVIELFKQGRRYYEKIATDGNQH